MNEEAFGFSKMLANTNLGLAELHSLLAFAQSVLEEKPPAWDTPDRSNFDGWSLRREKAKSLLEDLKKEYFRRLHVKL